MTMAATDHPSEEGVNNEKEVPNHQSRRRANENIDWQNESTFMTRDIEEEDFHSWISSICKAVAKEHILLCDIANVACALLFQIILLSVGDESGAFVFATPFYSVHIMLNVKKKSMLSSSNNSNNDDGGDNDDETNHNNIDDDDDAIPFSVPFVKMVACVWAMWIIRSIIVWSIYNTEEEFMESICWAVWTTGCIFNLRFLTHDMKSLRAVSHRQIRPLFHTFSLPVGWVANFLCLIGVVFGGIGSGLDPDAGPCILPIVLLGMGLAFYIIHSILFGLSICFGHILYECFSDENLLAVLRIRGENNGDDNGGDDDDICRRMRKDDILKIQCLFLMPIFILVGTQSTGGREIYKPIPIMATIMGGVLYLSYTILDMRKRKANGASSDITKIGMCGGIMWCIGSLLFWCLVADQWGVPTRVIGIFWMIGCFCNLFVITSDLSELSGRDGQARPLFKILFVWTSLATNILNAIGAGFIVSDISFNIGGVLLTFGFVLFFVQPFLLALSIICGHVVFLIHISTPTPGSSGDHRGGMEDCVIPLLDKKNDTSCDTTTTVV